MFSLLNQWLHGRGVRMSEVTFSLPFVQVSLQPSESMPGSSVARMTHTERPPSQGHSVELVVTAQGEESNALVREGLLRAKLSFNLASQIDYWGDPQFLLPWQDFQGKVELRPGDMVWLRLSCTNTADRVLHEVPISMNGLPQFANLPAVATTSDEKRGLTGTGLAAHTGILTRAGRGLTVPFINPGETISLHCFFRVPTKRKASGAFFVEPLPAEVRKKLLTNVLRCWSIDRQSLSVFDLFFSGY